MAAAVDSPTSAEQFSAGTPPETRVATWLSLGHAAVWALLLIRWVTFSAGWDAFEFEEALATLPSSVPYLLYGVGIAIDLLVGVLLLRGHRLAKPLGIGRNVLFILLAVGFLVIAIATLALLNATLSGIYASALYRYAADGNTSGYFEQELIANAFRQK